MINTPAICAKCASVDLQRNGTRDGHARYRCTACGHQARLVPAAAARTARYAQVDRLLAERNSQSSIVRVTGVSRVAVARLAKKAQVPASCLPRRRSKKAQKKRWEVLELDEMWTFVGRKPRKVWLWLAVERARRCIVAWVLGDRSAATALRLWQALPTRYRRHCWYFTDLLPAYCRLIAGLLPAYAQVLPRWQHRPCPKGEGQTSIVEAVNCALRQRCGVLVRKSCSFSKCLVMHKARIKIVIDNYNRALLPN